MSKVKCKRAIRRVGNVVTMVAHSENKVSQTVAQRGARKGRLKSGMNAIDKEMKQLLKMEKYPNSKIKKIMSATKFAHKKAERAA